MRLIVDRVGIESGFLIRWSVNLENEFHWHITTDIFFVSNMFRIRKSKFTLQYTLPYNTPYGALSKRQNVFAIDSIANKRESISYYHPPGSRHKVLHSASVGSKILCFLNLTPGRGNEHKLESESEAIEPLQRPTHHLWMIPPTQRKKYWLFGRPGAQNCTLSLVCEKQILHRLIWSKRLYCHLLFRMGAFNIIKTLHRFKRNHVWDWFGKARGK